jgi:hypothetical protein
MWLHKAQRAFIVVFPDSLEVLRFFWVTQMYETNSWMVMREQARLVDPQEAGTLALFEHISTCD